MKKPSFLPRNAGWVLPGSFAPFAAAIGALPPLDFNLEDLLGRYRSLETQLAFLPPAELSARWIMPLLEALGYGLYPNTGREKGFPDALLFANPVTLNTHLRSRSVESAWRQGEGIALVAGRSQRSFEEPDDLPESPTFASAPLTRFLSLDEAEGRFGWVTNGLLWRLQSIEHPDACLELDSTQLWERRDRAGLAEFAKWIHPGRQDRVAREGYHSLLERDAQHRARVLDRAWGLALAALALLNKGFLARLRKHKAPLSSADRQRAAVSLARLVAFRAAESDIPADAQPEVAAEWALKSGLQHTYSLARWPMESLTLPSAEWSAISTLFSQPVWTEYRQLRVKTRTAFWSRVLEAPLTDVSVPLALDGVEANAPALRPYKEDDEAVPALKPGDAIPARWDQPYPPASAAEAALAAHVRRIAGEWPAGGHLAESRLAIREEIIREKGLGRKKALHDYQRLRQQALKTAVDRSWLQWDGGAGLGLIGMADALARHLMREEAFPLVEEGKPWGYSDLTSTLLQRCLYACDRDPAAVEMARHFLAGWSGVPADRLLVRTGNPLLGAHPARLGDAAPDAASLAARQAHQGSFVEFEFRDRIRAVLSDFETRDAVESAPAPNGAEDGLRQRLSLLARRFETLADLWLLIQGGQGIAVQEYQNLLDHLKDPAPEWEAATAGLDPHLESTARLGVLHWPLVFPERFFEAGRTKPDGGFDRIWLGLSPDEADHEVKPYYKNVARVHRSAARGLAPAGWIVFHRLWECLCSSGEAEWLVSSADFEAIFPQGAPAGRLEVESGREIFLLNLQAFHRPDPVPQPHFKPQVRIVVVR